MVNVNTICVLVPSRQTYPFSGEIIMVTVAESVIENSTESLTPSPSASVALVDTPAVTMTSWFIIAGETVSDCASPV